MTWIFRLTVLFCVYSLVIGDDLNAFSNRLRILESVAFIQIDRVRDSLDVLTKRLLEISSKIHCSNESYESPLNQLSDAFRNPMVGVSTEKKNNRIKMDDLYRKQLTLALLIDNLEKGVRLDLERMKNDIKETYESNLGTTGILNRISTDVSTLRNDIKELNLQTSNSINNAILQTRMQWVAMIQNKLTTICPSGWTKYKQSCYYKYTVLLTWNEAYRVCAEVDAILPEIQDWGTNIFLSSLKGDSQIWLGATDINLEGFFVWNSTATPISFTFWGKDQPNNLNGKQDCVGQGYNASYLKWNDIGCNSRKEFVCQYDPKKYNLN